MNVPKYVLDIIESRKRAAEKFWDMDVRLTNWIQHNEIDADTCDYNGGAESLFNPADSASRIIEAIERK